LNEVISRRNPFWVSIAILCHAIAEDHALRLRTRS
jgi:hypothetical protein